jgi:hypothetical protein
MANATSTQLRALWPGAILALLAILFGFGLGGAFGAAEDSLKGGLRASADAVFETVYAGDAARRDAVVKKSWSYMKRAHLHGGAIGAAALASVLLLALLGPPGWLEQLSAFAFGAGALLYAVFWLSAGLTAPGLGSTHDAKEALGWLAIPGSGLAILGLVGTIAALLRSILGPGADGY